MNSPRGDGGPAHDQSETGADVGRPGHAAHSEASEHSIWPIIVAAGVLIAGIGALAWLPIAAVGVVVIVVAIAGWLWQPWEPA